MAHGWDDAAVVAEPGRTSVATAAHGAQTRTRTYVAFAAVALVSAVSAWMMWKLPRDAGAEMAGRAQPGGEVAEPKPAQLPAT